jgi:hypothetical protein
MDRNLLVVILGSVAVPSDHERPVVRCTKVEFLVGCLGHGPAPQHPDRAVDHRDHVTAQGLRAIELDGPSTRMVRVGGSDHASVQRRAHVMGAMAGDMHGNEQHELT